MDTETKVSILLVDDRPENLLALEVILEDLGQHLMRAASGQEALKILLAEEFAVVLLDVQMPGMDGFETARFMREREPIRHTPIIFLTAYATEDMQMAQGYALGAVDYISKPFTPEIVKAKVTTFVELAKRRAALRVEIAQRERAEQEVRRLNSDLERRVAERTRAAEAAQQRLSFLAEASRVLASSLEYDATLEHVANLVVPHLADWCTVDILEEDGTVRPVAVAHVDPAKIEWARQFQHRYPHDPGQPRGLPYVLRTGEPELYREITDEMLAAATPDEGQLRLLREIGFTSAMTVPLVARDRVLGAISFVSAESGVHYDEDDLGLAQDLARRASVAIDNARLYQEARRAEETLRQQAKALAEAGRRKDEFLSLLAHELRNPLGAMSNSLHVMGLSRPQTAVYDRARESALRQLQHQTRMIDDLLDVSRLSRARLELRMERLDLVRLVRETVEDYRSVMEGASLALTTELPGASVPVVGDRTRLAQVLGNLLDNAARFTPPGGSVNIRLAVGPEDSGVAVTVSDTGVGIEPDLLPRVFDTLTQADRSLDRTRGGLGLGLALVKGLMELHGGEVRVQSEGLGRGTVATFLLPIQRELPIIQDAPRPTVQALGSLRILVVEDNRDAAETLRDLLVLFGYEVEIAFTGPEGMEAARQFHPEVVLCDIGLPGMDGYEVASELRKDPATARAHLIAVTGYGGENDRRRSQEVGFEEHLTKPVDPAELQRLLASVVPQ